MRELALHQITMMDGGPEGLVRFAAEMRLRRVCLFTASPRHAGGSNMFPVVDADNAGSFKKFLRDHHVSIINAEYFPIMPDCDVSEYTGALELAADLGATRAVTHIHETSIIRAEDQLAKLCALATSLGMEVGLEFTGFAKGCDSLIAAKAWHDRMGQANLKIAIDALHLFRTGGALEQMEALDPEMIGYAQICDGPDFRLSDDYIAEAMNRQIPGDGIFPLKEFVTLLGDHVDIDIEVPHTGGISPKAWATRAVHASQSLLQ
ncbi:sugar phosphate isomerase/epimerase family protein [Parasphingorhabdus halotolerans]|uniref:Sugar phosphate isomerase/epimerase n=1 Tax=Parasphingorhabdus halotolerans TaxID=2725558 RepID=A0A6H2DP79_9SPHN|nr:sugar phosphate isomerase/epimerase [Parasphingorhabdus halotolerans]QJB70144.1 sugar phosphate isomerase/epimerase [Parasphingorhabdus halotolerans]